jgi:hypothetical protein
LASLQYQRGTFLEALGDKASALNAYREAFETISPPLSGQQQQQQQQHRDLFLSCVLRLELEGGGVKGGAGRDSSAPVHVPGSIERVPFGSLTYSQFLQRYALRSIPVIFTGASSHLLSCDFDWSLRGIAASPLGACGCTPKVRLPESCEWAQHEDRPRTSLAAFISKLQQSQQQQQQVEGKGDGVQSQNPATDVSEKHVKQSNNQFQEKQPSLDLEYVVDWSLPQHCPQLLEMEARGAPMLRLPALCAADWLQDTPPNTLYRDTWPSLFVGPAGSSSGLHTGKFVCHLLLNWLID